MYKEGTAFGKVIDGDFRVVELGSWLQPTKADYYYLQRLSVMLRQRKPAKVYIQGIVQRVRDRLLAGRARRDGRRRHR